MTDVAEAAGVARATVYRYFPTRQSLLENLATAALREIDLRFASARLDKVPTREAITRVIRALVEIGDAFIVVTRERTPPEEFDRILSRPVDALFECARKQGTSRDDLPVRWLTEFLLGVVLSVLTAPTPRGREDTIAAITSLVLDGTTPRGPRPL
jgi:AcrR family transcriptional regulator